MKQKPMMMSSVALASVLAMPAAAASLERSAEAIENATVQPAGVRSGSNGINFFNIEGSDNGTFASYAVARFDLAALRSEFDTAFGAGLWVIDGVRLELTQSNAGFTSNGPVTIHFTENDTVSLTGGSAELQYPVAGDFPDAMSLATYDFVEQSSGTLEQHVLFTRGASGPAGQALAADVLAGQLVTLALVDGSASVAATYAGLGHSSFAGPTLVVVAAPVPEPAAVVLMLAGLGVLGIARRFH